jgi:chemotaxis protein MotB
MSRKKQKDYDQDEHSNERWLVSYADFITLMFAFFVILYATSERNAEKSKGFQDSVEKYLVKAGAMGESGARIEPGEKNFSVLEPPIQTYRPSKPDDTKLLSSVEGQIEEKLTAADRKKYLIDISPEDRGVRLILSGREIFSGESQKFSASAIPFVDRLAEILKAQKMRLMIEGHVATGHHGDFSSPWELASARAINMLRYFEKKHEIAEKTMAASTFGDSRPMSSKAETASNDRIEMLVYYNDAEF